MVLENVWLVLIHINSDSGCMALACAFTLKRARMNQDKFGPTVELWLNGSDKLHRVCKKGEKIAEACNRDTKGLPGSAF